MLLELMWMREVWLVLTHGADVIVRAYSAPETLAGLQFPVAYVAAGCESRGTWVVQVIQNHHGRVLGPSERVKLIVVALAK